MKTKRTERTKRDIEDERPPVSFNERKLSKFEERRQVFNERTKTLEDDLDSLVRVNQPFLKEDGTDGSATEPAKEELPEQHNICDVMMTLHCVERAFKRTSRTFEADAKVDLSTTVEQEVKICVVFENLNQ